MVLTIDDLAKRFEISPRRARDWVRLKRIPYIRIPHTRKYTTITEYKQMQELRKLTKAVRESIHKRYYNQNITETLEEEQSDL